MVRIAGPLRQAPSLFGASELLPPSILTTAGLGLLVNMLRVGPQ